MSPDVSQTSQLDQDERSIVSRQSALLDLWPGPVDTVEKLSVGRSGSLVVRLSGANRRMILKITTDPGRLARARSELRMISEAPTELAAAMPRYIAGRADAETVCLVTEEHRPFAAPG